MAVGTTEDTPSDLDVLPPIEGGGGGGAPVDASYITVNDESAVLPNSRQLESSDGSIIITDNGPGDTIDITTSGGLTSPLTTTGDIWGYDSTDNRIPVGSDGQVLTADSSQALGVKYAPLPQQYPIYVYFA